MPFQNVISVKHHAELHVAYLPVTVQAGEAGTPSLVSAPVIDLSNYKY